jgi:hypothetical protein
VYDALSESRCYKPAWEEERVIEHFRENSGKLYEASLVQALLDDLPELRAVREAFPDSASWELAQSGNLADRGSGSGACQSAPPERGPRPQQRRLISDANALRHSRFVCARIAPRPALSLRLFLHILAPSAARIGSCSRASRQRGRLAPSANAAATNCTHKPRKP